MDTFNPNQMPPMPAAVEKKSVGPLIAVVVILALIVVGGLYFLKERSAPETYAPIEQKDPITNALNQQSSSDEVSAIEADLNATNLDNLDDGSAALEAGLQ